MLVLLVVRTSLKGVGIINPYINASRVKMFNASRVNQFKCITSGTQLTKLCLGTYPVCST